MKALLFSLTLLLSSNLFAAECYMNLNAERTLNLLEVPQEICLSNLSSRGGKLTGAMTVDGVETQLNVKLTDIKSLGVHFDKGRAELVNESMTLGSCDTTENVVVSINLTMDYDGSLIGIRSVEGVSSYTNDNCHSPMKKSELIYDKAE